MEQPNIEAEIKQRLQERQIEPSAESWKKLSEKLDSNVQKKDNKFWWMGIAAAVLVGVFIGINFFSPTVPAQDVQVVDAPIEKAVEKLQFDQTEIVSEEMKTGVVSNETEFSKPKKETSNTEKAGFIEEKESNMIAEATKHTKIIEKPFSEENFTGNNQEIASNPVPQLEISLDSEVDALLSNAKKEILLNQQNDRQMASAESLLRAVETDLDTSFRNQVFEMLKDGFSKVKVAFAEGNK